MVGIYSKFNKLFSKITDTVKDNVLPALGKIGDFADSDLARTISNYAAPVLNSFVPSLGTGLNSALPFISNLSKKARKIQNDWSSCNNQVPKGIHLSKRPSDLHSRIQSKALPPPDSGAVANYVRDDYTPRQKSFVEEIHEVD
jgi:hypothetical protein